MCTIINQIHGDFLCVKNVKKAGGNVARARKADNRKLFCDSKDYDGSDKRNAAQLPARTFSGEVSAIAQRPN